DQEHLAEKDDDVLEEVVALDASEVVAEKAKKKRKRKVTGDASGSGSVIPSDAMRPLVTPSVTPILDVGPMDFVSGLNLWTRPPYVRYVVSSDSSHHSASYFEADSLVRSPAADVPVVTVDVTTTIDADIAVGAKAKDRPKDFEHIGDSASIGGVDADAASISKSKKPSISLDSFYASQSLDTKTMHRVYVLRWKVTNDSVLDDPYVYRDMMDRLAPPALFTQLHVMDYDQLYSKFNVGAARQTTLLSEKDAEIAHLKSLLSLKEAEAAEAISLRRQLSTLEAVDAAKSIELMDLKEKNFALEGERNVLSERVESLDYVATYKEIELVSLSSQVATLTADLSGFQLFRDKLNSKLASLEFERDCLATQKSSLESAFEFLKEQVEKMQDEQVGVLSERVAAIDSDLAIGRAIDKGMQDGLTAGIEHGRAGRSIMDVVAFNPSAESDYVVAVNALQGVSFLLLSQLEDNKDANMADFMDLLHLEGPAAETSEARQLQPSLDQLMILI
ncbi:hypothetical protein Tco_1486380, partial [Tanacetum coccineum]